MKRIYLHGHSPELNSHKAAAFCGYMKAIDKNRYLRPTSNGMYILDVVSPKTLGLHCLHEYQGEIVPTPTREEFRLEVQRIMSELKPLQRRKMGIGEINAKEKYYNSKY